MACLAVFLLVAGAYLLIGATYSTGTTVSSAVFGNALKPGHYALAGILFLFGGLIFSVLAVRSTIPAPNRYAEQHTPEPRPSGTLQRSHRFTAAAEEFPADNREVGFPGCEPSAR